jgi:hypothetical protein
VRRREETKSSSSFLAQKESTVVRSMEGWVRKQRAEVQKP